MNESIHIVCPHCQAINRLPAQRLNEHPNCGHCQKALFDGHPYPSNQMQFERHIQKNDIPVLVDFWAAWCGPCKMMAPQFETAATLLEPKLRLLKVDVQAEQALAARHSIQGIPALILFAEGKEKARISGAMAAQDLVQWVNQQI